jgi:hypothetical protein
MEKLLTDDDVVSLIRKIKEKIASKADFDPPKMLKDVQKQKEDLRNLFGLSKTHDTKKKTLSYT